jgi:putative tRNA adenosine deaminase-associated protein
MADDSGRGSGRDTATDFAVVAYREEGAWTVAPLPLRLASDLDGIVTALRQLPAETGAMALVSVADDFFLVVRVRGSDVRLLVSDAALADEWPLGREALEALDVEPPAEEEVTPAGELDVFADLGLAAMELAALCADEDAYPDELLGRVASRLGFGDEFERAVDGTL